MIPLGWFAKLSDLPDPTIECRFALDPSCASFETATGSVANILVAVASTLFFLYFLYGAMLYLTGAADENQLTRAKKTMMYAATGLVIIVSIWAVFAFLITELGIGS